MQKSQLSISLINFLQQIQIFLMQQIEQIQNEEVFEQQQYPSYQVEQIKCDFRDLQIKTWSTNRRIQLKDNKNIFTTCFSSNQFQQLKSINIQGCIIQNLIKLQAPLLQSIRLHRTGIQSLDQFAIAEYPSLKSITISYRSRLRSLPKLNACRLEQITVETNWNDKGLNIQDFCKGDYPQLKSINLNQNSIHKLPTINCPKLQVLQMRGNNIKSIGQFLKGNYPLLKELCLHSNNVQQLPQLSKFGLIEKINFGGNKIKDLSVFKLGQFVNLKYLNLSKNQLSQFPSIKANNLEQLYLGNNHINKVQEDNLNYPKLRVCQICNNEIQLIPTINSVNLVCLNVGRNKISLEYAQLQLSDFKCKGQMENIILKQKYKKQQQIDVNANKQKQSCLAQFLCHQNCLKYIPKLLTFSNINGLQYLNLKSNQIQNIQLLSQVNLTQIQNIYLNDNKICSFKVFAKLQCTNLSKLYLDKNQSNRIYPSIRMKVSNQNSIKKLIQFSGNAKGDCQYFNWVFKIEPKQFFLNITISKSEQLLMSQKIKGKTQYKNGMGVELREIRQI